jgi:hypothetical protein
MPRSELHIGGEMRDRRMGTIYAILGAIALVATAVALLFDGSAFADFGPELATETLGIILTLVLVQRVLERQERNRRLRASIGALRKARRALAGIASAWADLVKTAQRPDPADMPDSLAGLFRPHVTEQLVYGDLGRFRPDGDGDGRQTWLGWCAARLVAGQAALREVITVYGSVLDSVYLEAVDDFVDDPFIDLILDLHTTGERDQQRLRTRLNLARAHREAHFSRLVEVIRLHNELAAEAAQVRSRRSVPRTGAIGMELPLGHDIKVDQELSRQWWRSAPLPGSLRVERKRTAV